MIFFPDKQISRQSNIYGLFSDQKGGNKLLSVAEISARQVLCCYQMLLPDGAGVAKILTDKVATRVT